MESICVLGRINNNLLRRVLLAQRHYQTKSLILEAQANTNTLNIDEEYIRRGNFWLLKRNHIFNDLRITPAVSLQDIDDLKLNVIINK